MFSIMGKFNGRTEQLSEAFSREEAEKLATDYRNTLGDLWAVWVEDWSS